MGFGIYQQLKQVDRICEQIGQPKRIPLEKAVVIFAYTLFPATIYSVSEAEEDNPSDSPTRAGLKRGIRLIRGLSFDIPSIVVPYIMLINAQYKLALLGLLAKPLFNAVSHIASDVMQAREFKRKDLPKASPGTYDLLEKAYDESYDRHLKLGIVKDSQAGTRAVIRKEEICAESGGSCMVLYVPMEDGAKKGIGYAHVTGKDVVVSIGSTLITGDENDKKPGIDDLLVSFKKPLNK